MENNFEQPISQQVPIQQPVNEIPESKNKLKLISLIVILLLIVGVGAYLLGSKQNISNKQEAIVSPTSLPTEVPPKVDDPTANWKTYTNSQNLYHFRYPDAIFTIQENGSRTRLLEGMGYSFEINVIQATDTVGNWLTKEKNNGQFPDSNWKSIQSTFQNHSALLLQSLPDTMQVAMDVLVVKNKNMIYEISFSKETSDKTIVDQILSTFKFTNQLMQVIPTVTQETSQTGQCSLNETADNSTIKRHVSFKEELAAAQKWEPDAYLIARTDHYSFALGTTDYGGPDEIYASNCTNDYLVYFPPSGFGGPEPIEAPKIMGTSDLNQLPRYHALNVLQLPYNQALLSPEFENYGIWQNKFNVQDSLSPADTKGNYKITINNASFYACCFALQINNSKKYGILYDVLFYKDINTTAVDTAPKTPVALATFDANRNFSSLKVY